MPRVSQQSIDEVLTMGIGWATLEEPADRRRAGELRPDQPAGWQGDIQ